MGQIDFEHKTNTYIYTAKFLEKEEKNVAEVEIREYMY